MSLGIHIREFVFHHSLNNFFNNEAFSDVLYHRPYNENGSAVVAAFPLPPAPRILSSPPPTVLPEKKTRKKK